MIPTKDDRMVTMVPFSGFYETIHSDRLERFFIDEELPQEEQDKLWEEIDWKTEQIDYCKEYLRVLSKILGFTLEFESMVSPREYNFTTDRLFAYIKREDFEKLKAGIDDIKMEEYVKDHFTSYDGFSSFYSNCWDDWLDQKEEFDHNQIGSLLECHLETEFGNDWDGWDGEVIEGMNY